MLFLYILAQKFMLVLDEIKINLPLCDFPLRECISKGVRGLCCIMGNLALKQSSQLVALEPG